jgi:hypothetical protein
MIAAAREGFAESNHGRGMGAHTFLITAKESNRYGADAGIA